MHNIAKTTKSDDVTALFKVFSGAGGSKIDEKRVQKQHPAETGLQERLGRLLGSILEPFGGHFGSQNRSGRGSEHELDLRVVFTGPLGATTPCDGGFETDRRGGVGEG